MRVPEEFHEVRFRTPDELAAAIAGRRVYETPSGFADIIAGLRIFEVRDTSGQLTGERSVWVSDLG